MRVLLLILFSILPIISYGLDSKKQDRQHIDSLNLFFLNKEKFDSTDLSSINTLFNRSTEIKYTKGEYTALLNISRFYQYYDKYDSAIYYTNICLQQVNSVKDSYLRTRIYELTGSLFLSIIDYPKAFKYLRLAEEGYMKLEKEDELLRVYNYLGILSDGLHKKDEAIAYYREILNKSIEKNDKRGMAQSYNNLATVYNDNIELEKDSALLFYNKAVSLNLENKNFNWLARNYQNLGIIYMHLDSLDISMNYYRKALHISDSLKDNETKAKVLMMMGYNYHERHEFKKSLPYYEEALKISKASPDLIETELSGYYYLFDYYYHMEDYKKSLEYEIKNRRLADSLFLAQNTKEFLQQELKYKYDEILHNKKLKEQRRLIILLSILLATIIGLYLIIRLYKAQKYRAEKSQIEKENLEIELDHKKQELNNYVLNLIHINEKNIRIIKKMLDKKHLLKKENQKLIDQIVKELEEDQFKNIWDEFEIRFSQVHKEFYKNLITKFPDLTTSEKRLCAFLKLDMTTKEISHITGQTLRALEMARLRLRKKLGITNTPLSFSQFLQELEKAKI